MTHLVGLEKSNALLTKWNNCGTGRIHPTQRADHRCRASPGSTPLAPFTMSCSAGSQ